MNPPDAEFLNPRTGGPPLVLVIDDEDRIRRFLRVSLEAEGYQFIEAAHPRDGLAQVASRQPDLVVLDLGLPDMDGHQVLSEIRAWTNVPVLILSVRDAESEIVRALDGGANDYVTKPFGLREFLARLRALLRSSRREDEELSGYDDGHLQIDVALRRVVRDGEEVHLTPKEYALLIGLLRHRNRVVTQTRLLTDLWGETHRHDTHYLRILIARLRKKLGDDHADPMYVLTEPGVGYRFLAPPMDSTS